MNAPEFTEETGCADFVGVGEGTGVAQPDDGEQTIFGWKLPVAVEVGLAVGEDELTADLDADASETTRGEAIVDTGT